MFGILRSGTWGFVKAKPEAPEWLGLSPVIWLILGGGGVLWLFRCWENRLSAPRRRAAGRPGDPAGLGLRAGLTSFFFQYFLQGGLFFAMPLFLSIALGLSAIETGVRLLPLSFTLIARRGRDPEALPATPRRGGWCGSASCDVRRAGGAGRRPRGRGGAGDRHLAAAPGRLGIGALASQLGSVTVSSVPDEQSGEVGGLQNTVTNLGISVGTALTGAIVIAALSSSFLSGVEENPAVPAPVKARASTELAGGVPFLSDEELETALDEARVSPRGTEAIVEENETARLVGLRTALAVLAIFALLGLFFTGRLPTRQPSATPETAVT